MRTLKQTVTVDVLEYKELTTKEKILLERACKVRLNAQAPYSRFLVGCSMMTTKGLVSDGCNVENVNYSETIHAEENAISTAIAKSGIIRIGTMAVVGAPIDQRVPWPPIKPRGRSPIVSVSEVCPSCEHCLQVILENCFNEEGKFDPSVKLLSYHVYGDESGEIFRTTIGDACPMPFLPRRLGKNLSA